MQWIIIIKQGTNKQCNYHYRKQTPPLPRSLLTKLITLSFKLKLQSRTLFSSPKFLEHKNLSVLSLCQPWSSFFSFFYNQNKHSTNNYLKLRECLLLLNSFTPAYHNPLILADQRLWFSLSFSSESPASSSASLPFLPPPTTTVAPITPRRDRSVSSGKPATIEMIMAVATLSFWMVRTGRRGIRLWGLLGFKLGSSHRVGGGLWGTLGCRPIDRDFNGIEQFSFFLKKEKAWHFSYLSLESC